MVVVHRCQVERSDTSYPRPFSDGASTEECPHAAHMPMVSSKMEGRKASCLRSCIIIYGDARVCASNKQCNNAASMPKSRGEVEGRKGGSVEAVWVGAEGDHHVEDAL